MCSLGYCHAFLLPAAGVDGLVPTHGFSAVITAKRSEGKPVVGPMIIGKPKSFYDEMKIADRCTFSEGSDKNLHVRT